MSEKMILDGEIVDGRRLELGVLGRGIAYGYGVFETIKFIGGHPCFWREHLARLQRAVVAAGLSAEIDAVALLVQARQLFAISGVADGVFKIIICEDQPGRCRVALFIRNVGVPQPGASMRLRLSPVVKASRAFTSRHKTLNYMETVRELELARQHGFDECLYRNEFGQLTETSVSNIFLVQDGILVTPSLDCGLLDGILRGQLIAVAEAQGIPVQERPVSLEELLQADEVFVSNSAIGAQPARELDAGEEGSAVYETRLAGQLGKRILELERSALSSPSDRGG